MKQIIIVIIFILIQQYSCSAQTKSQSNVVERSRNFIPALKPSIIDCRKNSAPEICIGGPRACKSYIYDDMKYIEELIHIGQGSNCSKYNTEYGTMNNYYDLLKFNQPDESAFTLCQNFALHQLRLNYRK
ncbi:MAG TPA: hypothetical protein PLU17_02630 [Chitinophagaceae bacterium]|nr:hypothetical protein [Chitinophagaceae bacterium]